MINYKLLAIQNLAPGAIVSIIGDKIIWHSEDISQPSHTEILDETIRLEYLEEIKEYQRQRSSEYPDYADYLDGVVKGDQDQIDAYVAACQAVKDKYPKVEVDVDELAARKAQALAEYQLEEYTKAMARLSQYQVALGREEVIENQPTGERIWDEETGEMVDVMSDIVTVSAIDPVDATVEQTTYDEAGVATTTTIENPLITQDNAERAEAQAVVDSTPSEVVDAYNAL